MSGARGNAFNRAPQTTKTGAKQLGAFYLFSELPADVYNPGFFQGTAGIGYELLRLAYPESLPSVLLWD